MVVNLFNPFFLSSFQKKQAKNESPLKEISSSHDGSGEWVHVPEVTLCKRNDDLLLVIIQAQKPVFIIHVIASQGLV